MQLSNKRFQMLSYLCVINFPALKGRTVVILSWESLAHFQSIRGTVAEAKNGKWPIIFS